MASTLILRGCSIFCVSPYSPKCHNNQTLSLNPSQFVSSKSFLNLKKESLFSTIQVKKFKTHHVPRVFAVQSNFFKVLQTVWKVGYDGIEAGTNLVPDSIPKPVARISVSVVAVTLGLFVLKAFLSTAFFVAATMGLIYFIFIALNKDEGPRGGGGSTSTDESLEEARKIMEKYK